MSEIKEQPTQGEKIIAALSYLIFFLPLINRNKKEFNRFHANQGLLLFLLIFLVNLLDIGVSFFPYVDWVFVTLFLLVILYYFYIGIRSAAAGEMRQYPYIGWIHLIRSKDEPPIFQSILQRIKRIQTRYGQRKRRP